MIKRFLGNLFGLNSSDSSRVLSKNKKMRKEGKVSVEMIHPSNEETFMKTIESFVGQHIDEVYYAQVNYQERPYLYRDFHLCDKAVLIKFQNNKWLNWVWIEGGLYQIDEIAISTEDLRNELVNKYTAIVDVSASVDWSLLLNKPIVAIKYKTIDVEGVNQLSDMQLIFPDSKVTICATVEPDPNLLPELSGLPYSSDWTVLVFNEKLLEDFERSIN